MENLTKVCSKCKVMFEKNSNNFFEKMDSFKLASGGRKYFKRLTSCCKKCHGIKHTERNRAKRYKELGCNAENYKEFAKKLFKSNAKFSEAIHLPFYRDILHNVKKGYEYRGLEQYIKDRDNNFFRKKAAKSMIKLNYPECDFVKDLSREIINKVKSEYNNRVLPRGVIANRLGLKLSECSDEMIERQRLIIQINQILNNTEYDNSTK